MVKEKIEIEIAIEIYFELDYIRLRYLKRCRYPFDYAKITPRK